MTDSETTLSARITGKVQGVYYRAWTKEQAEACGLSGWVRNEADGSVSTVFSGPAGKIDEMIGALWEGPPAARVETVETAPADDVVGDGFRIER